MRLSLSGVYLATALVPSAPTISANKSIYTNDLCSLFSSERERGLRLNPTIATYLGDHRYDDRWQDLSPPAAK
jgi:hypothetical protein